MPEITFVSVRLVVDGREVVAEFHTHDKIQGLLQAGTLGEFLRALAEPPKLRPPEGGK